MREFLLIIESKLSKAEALREQLGVSAKLIDIYQSNIETMYMESGILSPIRVWESIILGQAMRELANRNEVIMEAIIRSDYDELKNGEPYGRICVNGIDDFSWLGEQLYSGYIFDDLMKNFVHLPKEAQEILTKVSSGAELISYILKGTQNERN